MADKIQFRRDTTTNWASVNPILSQGELGLDITTSQFKVGNGVTAWNSLAYGGLVGPNGSGPIYFGDGSDGNLTLTNAVLTLNRDYYLNNYTPVGTSYIDCNGWRLFIKGVWDTTLATSSNTIRCLMNNGAVAVAQTGGAGGIAIVAQTLGASTAGGAGATGVVGVGAVAAATTAVTPANGGASGAGGAGGAGVSGAGGASRAASSSSLPVYMRAPVIHQLRQGTLIQGGAGGPGGSSGAGDGVNLGRGGGGGGGGGGVAMVFVNQITTSGATVAPQLSVKGGNGAMGANGVAGNVGGGGGGSGGGGGFLYCVYGSRSGTAVTGFFEASGGDGANGGSGFGTGVFGTGGGSGAGGTIIAINAATGASATVINTTPSVSPTGQIGGLATAVVAAI